MLIVAQFPLADSRPFLEAPSPITHRLPFPSWPLPRANREFVRGSGIVRERRRGGIDTWPGEEAYCMAHRALKFPPRLDNIRLNDATDNISFLCAFRRYYSDGSAVSRVEIGLKTLINNRHFDYAINASRCLTIIENYLSIPVRVYLPGREWIWRELVNASDALAGHYLFATTERVKEHFPEVESWWIGAGQPLLLVEYQAGEIVQLPRTCRSVEIDYPPRARIHHSRLEFRGKRFGIWWVRNDRQQKDLLRRLRLNLFRLHAERECLKQVLRNIDIGRIAPDAHTEKSDWLQQYLDNALNLLNKQTYCGLPQSKISQVAYQADNLVSPGERTTILDRLSGIRKNLYRKLERTTLRQSSGKQPITVLGGNNNITIGYEEIVGGKTVINYNVTFGDKTKFIGNLVVANAIRNSFNQVTASNADREIKDKLEELQEVFADISDRLPAEKAEQAARDLETLTREAVSPEPRKQWYQLAADGLIEAAEKVGAIAAPVITTVKALLSILGG